jgi:transposase
MRTDQSFTTGGEEPVLAVSLELAAAKWKVALHDGRREKPPVHTGRPTPGCGASTGGARPDRGAQAEVVATDGRTHRRELRGRSGRILDLPHAAGAPHRVYVVDPASIPVERHKRRAKTDRLDAIKLVINLRAWLRGERDRMHVVHVPSPQDEASRQLMRDRGELQKEVLQYRDRMRKLLATLGCWDELDHKGFADRLVNNEVRCHDGAPLPPELRERLLRECERLVLVTQQLAALEKTRQAAVPAHARRRSDDLARLKGIGEVGASRLALELFWREFSNRRQVGACVGLVPQPYDSGESHVDQGISKQGNRISKDFPDLVA